MKGYATRWLRPAVLGATLAIWAASAQPAWTAEQPAADGAEVAAGTAEPGKDETAGQPQDKTSATKQGDPSPEIFVPTEEVSEDFAVSFPVDI
jgi:hypothetical protein